MKELVQWLSNISPPTLQFRRFCQNIAVLVGMVMQIQKRVIRICFDLPLWQAGQSAFTSG